MTNDPKKTMLGWAAGHDLEHADTEITSPLPAYLQYSQPEQVYPQATPEQQHDGRPSKPAYPPSYGQPSRGQSPYAQAPYEGTSSKGPSAHLERGYEAQAPAQSYAQQGYEAQAQSPYAQGTASQAQPYAQQGFESPAQQGFESPAQSPAQQGFESPAQSYAQQGFESSAQSQRSVHGYPQASPQHGGASHASSHYGHVALPVPPIAAAPAPKRRRPIQRPIAGADATTGVPERVRFIRRTYLHLLGAILTFAGLLYLLMTNGTLATNVSAPLVTFALGGRWNWGVVLAVFMVVSWVADYWASHATSRVTQYLGLGFYVIAEALIFVPLLAIVAWKTQAILAKGGGHPNIIRDSAFVTLGIFTALTASVFITRKDFSFLRSGLVMASGAALMLIVLSLTFGFNLGLVFSVAMVLLAAAYILYQTSQVLAHYDPRQHVAASLALFSSVALMFWYVIRIVMRSRE